MFTVHLPDIRTLVCDKKPKMYFHVTNEVPMCFVVHSKPLERRFLSIQLPNITPSMSYRQVYVLGWGGWGYECVLE